MEIKLSIFYASDALFLINLHLEVSKQRELQGFILLNEFGIVFYY